MKHLTADTAFPTQAKPGLSGPFAFRWAQILSENLSREEGMMIAPKAMIR
jgi:hypothetical protein